MPSTHVASYHCTLYQVAVALSFTCRIFATLQVVEAIISYIQLSAMCPIKISPYAAGPHGKQFFDLDGAYNPAVGRTEERVGFAGGFTHGVTVFGGGVPHDVRPPKARKDHGIVLFSSSILKPDLSHVLRIKPGTEDERQGRCGSFEHSLPKSRDTPVQLQELNHGTVLNVCPSLHPDLSYEGKTNIVGKRETERLGSRGGFTAGVRIWSG
eukprot:11162-Heterococcus_DN1.PRE.1